jgi:hypothetical protein
MRLDGALPFRGEVVWLTAAQGGRASGPPPTPEDQDYAATAHVPPATVDDGLASFVLRVMDRSAWRSEAAGAWLVIENKGAHRIDQGSVVVITEGVRPIAYFHVHRVVETC